MNESDRVKAFSEFRQRMNERILGQDNQVIRRFFALDTQTYKDGALDLKTKELLGLVASMVLRCDDFFVAFSVALVVGGSIVIPDLRRGVAFLDQLEGEGMHAADTPHPHD